MNRFSGVGINQVKILYRYRFFEKKYVETGFEVALSIKSLKFSEGLFFLFSCLSKQITLIFL